MAEVALLRLVQYFVEKLAAQLAATMLEESVEALEGKL